MGVASVARVRNVGWSPGTTPLRRAVWATAARLEPAVGLGVELCGDHRIQQCHQYVEAPGTARGSRASTAVSGARFLRLRCRPRQRSGHASALGLPPPDITQNNAAYSRPPRQANALGCQPVVERTPPPHRCCRAQVLPRSSWVSRSLNTNPHAVPEQHHGAGHRKTFPASRSGREHRSRDDQAIANARSHRSAAGRSGPRLPGPAGGPGLGAALIVLDGGKPVFSTGRVPPMIRIERHLHLFVGFSAHGNGSLAH